MIDSLAHTVPAFVVAVDGQKSTSNSLVHFAASGSTWADHHSLLYCLLFAVEVLK